MKKHQQIKHNAGYTLDQTILIVAIIAILITLIVATVGWNLLSRAGGTKLAAQLRQVEDANGQFYSEFGMWPGDAIAATGGTNNSTTRGAVLYSSAVYGSSTAPGADTLRNNHRNFLPGFEYDGVNNIIRHSFGAGGEIRQHIVDTGTNAIGSINNGVYYVVHFRDVPRAEAFEVDEKIDGTSGTNAGRVKLVSSTATTCTGTALASSSTDSAVGVCYVANIIQ